MSSPPRNIVIIGAGLAGARAAETLRSDGFDGRIVLLGAEPERPYERPPLSKEYLRGEAEARPYVHEASYYAEESIELRTSSRVSDLEPASSEVVLGDRERIGYDRLLLATGAEAKRPPIPGAELAGVRYLRTLADSEALADRLAAGARVAVIGAGWIGSEVAASARTKGCEVTLIEAGSVPLERVLGPEVGAIYRDIHLDAGVRFLGDASVEAIEGGERVEAVRLAGGEVVAADLVVIGVGVSPATELAERAGIEVGDGIVVDPGLRTSVPNVFAAGDVASVHHPFYGRQVRVEHWANAEAQGPAAARSMLGREVSFDEIPYFFSDQYDVGMEYGGLASGSDDVVFRGDVAGREFIAFWLREGRITAGMNVNVWDVNETIRELIRSGEEIDPAQLTDPGIPLERVVTDPAEAPR